MGILIARLKANANSVSQSLDLCGFPDFYQRRPLPGMALAIAVTGAVWSWSVPIT
jgi:hypothetical protein